MTTPTKRRTTEDDQAVIDKWAKKLGAKVVFDVPVKNQGGYSGPRANSARKEIHAIPLTESAEAFWSTMHELGHIAYNHAGADPFAMMFGGDPAIPEQEAEAWTWAVDHAERPLDEVGRASIGFSLASYIHSNGLHPGPNLDRMFRLVGPKLDTEAMRKAFPAYTWEIGAATSAWTKFASTPDLANAA